MSNLGKLARLTKRQLNRGYFSDLPVGTLFIIIEEINLPAYDLTGLFLAAKPHVLGDNKVYFQGYIEMGSWEILGAVENCVDFIRQASELPVYL